ncbi:MULTISPECIES: hypothetical protein [unclassified Streptomyces]|uniref:hypothetical protein n=1 Tax=unclassified Streptomyces TaxID=2593676 RepID=UPI00331977E2
MAHTRVRTYRLTNPRALGDSERRIPVPGAAPIGSITTTVIDGRPKRVLLTGTRLVGGVLVAELVDAYL